MRSDSSDIVASRSYFRWVWVAVGVVIGGALLATLVPIVEAAPPRPDVAVLVGVLTAVLMGVLVGYHSPGKTIAEPAVAGALLGVLTPIVLRIGFGFTLAPAVSTLGVFAGILLATAGGWVGEIMQGTIEDGDRESFQWVWVGVGSVLGVLLSVYSVFVLHALFSLSSLGILIAFLGSFFVTGFIVAFYSPGATVREPAVAASLVIMVDAMLALAGFRAPFPFVMVMIACVLAFFIAMVGGYLGEVAHNFRFDTSWGGTKRGRAIPKPGGAEAKLEG